MTEDKELLRKVDRALGLDKSTQPVLIGEDEHGQPVVRHVPTEEFIAMWSDPQEKLILSDDRWHIAAKDRFIWHKHDCRDVPEDAVEGTEGDYVTFIAWGDRSGAVVCFIGQEQQIAELPEKDDA